MKTLYYAYVIWGLFTMAMAILTIGKPPKTLSPRVALLSVAITTPQVWLLWQAAQR